MNKKKSTIMLIMITVLLIIFTATTSYSADTFSLNKIYEKAQDFQKHGKEPADEIISADDIEDKIIPIGQILVTIASFVIVIVTIIMAIRYLTSSPEQKGKLKQQLIGLVVSIIVIYGAVGIWTIIKSFMESTKL